MAERCKARKGTCSKCSRAVWVSIPKDQIGSKELVCNECLDTLDRPLVLLGYQVAEGIEAARKMIAEEARDN